MTKKQQFIEEILAVLIIHKQEVAVINSWDETIAGPISAATGEGLTVRITTERDTIEFNGRAVKSVMLGEHIPVIVIR